MLAVRGGPKPPLHPINRAELTMRVCPFVPDAHPLVLHPLDVRIAAEEPQQFHGNGLEMHTLGSDQEKAPGEVEPQLSAEHAARARAGAEGCLPVSGIRNKSTVEDWGN